MKLEPIAPYRLDAVWPRIAHWLARLEARFPPGWRLPDPRAACESRDAQLWLIRDGADIRGIVITQITTDTARVAEVIGLAGEGMEDWLHLLNDLEAWARREGCVAMICAAAREGWVRALRDYGWCKRAVVIERRL